MNRTKIQWTDWTWNPITGCLRRCHYCYARRMSYRLRGRFGYPDDDPFRPTLHPDKLDEPLGQKKPAKIFTVSMGDLFGDGVQIGWVQQVFDTVKSASWHTFQILTKCSERLPHWNFPSNCWVGITIDRQSRIEGLPLLLETNAKVKFVSFEPLLGSIQADLSGLDWIIIGAQTGPRAIKPKFKWVEDIVNSADDKSIPVFILSNLDYSDIRQEFPRS